MGRIVPCIWTDGDAEAAATLYTTLFGGTVLATSHFPTSGPNPAGLPPGSVLTVDFEIRGTRFTALNGGAGFHPNPSISFFVEVPHAEEVDRLYAGLAEGGRTLMPLGDYPWSERFVWVQDRFGVSWQIMVGPEALVRPCLMFGGDVLGRAAEAVALYTTCLGGDVEDIQCYDGQDGPEGHVKLARFRIADRPMAVMDTHMPHDFGFDEGVSLQVMCADQGEMDRVWASLTKGGEESVCGWLKDPFGVSWQVVPAELPKMMAADTPGRDRAFEAMLAMTKLDVAALRAAYAGDRPYTSPTTP